MVDRSQKEERETGHRLNPPECGILVTRNASAILIRSNSVESAEIFSVLRKDRNTLLDTAKKATNGRANSARSAPHFLGKRQRGSEAVLRLAPGTGIAAIFLWESVPH
jgi:hypothetical protein